MYHRGDSQRQKAQLRYTICQPLTLNGCGYWQMIQGFVPGGKAGNNRVEERKMGTRWLWWVAMFALCLQGAAAASEDPSISPSSSVRLHKVSCSVQIKVEGQDTTVSTRIAVEFPEPLEITFSELNEVVGLMLEELLEGSLSDVLGDLADTGSQTAAESQEASSLSWIRDDPLFSGCATFRWRPEGLILPSEPIWALPDSAKTPR